MTSETKPAGKNGNANGAANGAGPGQAALRVTLTLPDVYCLTAAIADRRGFPQEMHGYLAQQIVWLEERGLPGLVALLDDILQHHEQPWQDRKPRDMGDGMHRLDCPVISGVVLEKEFGTLIVSEKDQWGRVMGPSVPFLLLPRIAAYAARSGKKVHVGWLKGTPPQIKADTILDGDRLVSVGDGDALMSAEGVALREFDGDLPDTAKGAFRKSSVIHPDAMRALVTYIAEPVLGTDLPVDALIGRDGKTVALMKDLSKGDLSNLSIIARPRFEEPQTDGSGKAAPRPLDPGDAVHKTTRDSANFRLFTHLETLGWMQRRDDPETADAVDFGWTARGFRLLPQMYFFYMDHHYEDNQGLETA